MPVKEATVTIALGSVLLSLLNLASAALIAEDRRAGWLVALAAQIPWTWYDLWTRQFGFLLLTLIYVPVYMRGWRRARRPGGAPLSSTDVGPLTPRLAGILVEEAAATPSESMGFEPSDECRAPSRNSLRVRRSGPVPTWV